MEPEYLDVRDVAAILKVSTKTVLRLVERDPSVPALRLTGQTIRFHRERLLRWLRDQEQGRPRSSRHVRAVQESAG